MQVEADRNIKKDKNLNKEILDAVVYPN